MKCSSFSAFFLAVAAAVMLAACGGPDAAQTTDTGETAEAHSHAGDAAHEHGEDSHTHETMAADTAGTYVDSTGAFFDDDGVDEADHEHGPDTHEH